MSIKAGATSQSLALYITDTAGDPLTGLAYNSAGLTCYYMRPGAAAIAITLATLSLITSSWSSGGFKEVDGTNMPGWYRFDVPNAVIAAGVPFAALHFKGASGMAPLPVKLDLVAYDPQDTVRLGLTALPNVAAGASGGLPIGDGSGDVTVGAIGASVITAASIAPDAGTEIATALMDLSNGVESGLTVRQTMRMLAAVIAGEATVGSGTVAFKRRDGTTVAITVAHDTLGNRTDSTIGTL